MLMKQKRKDSRNINLKGLGPGFIAEVRVSLWWYPITGYRCIYISLCWLCSSNDGVVFELGSYSSNRKLDCCVFSIETSPGIAFCFSVLFR